MAFGPIIAVENEAQARRMFKGLGGAGKDLSRANRLVAKVVEVDARAAASGGTAQQSSAVGALAAKASQSAAQLAIKGTAGRPYAVGAFMGALKWKQFPKWVGAEWDITAGEGPYAVRDAFNESGLEKVKQAYVTEIGKTLASAGLEMT